MTSKKTLAFLFRAIEDIRGLSFNLSYCTKNILEQRRRISQIVNDVQETTNMKTAFEIKSQELDDKLKQIKSLTEEYCSSSHSR